MFTTKYNNEYFIIFGPLANFLLIKLIFRPAQQFEFDMPAIKALMAQSCKLLGTYSGAKLSQCIGVRRPNKRLKVFIRLAPE
jgi:hypothetical protein